MRVHEKTSFKSVKFETILIKLCESFCEMELSDLQSTFGDYLQYFKDIDFETFLIMKPEHIKEAIPSLGPGIKFENLYSKFLSGLDEVIIVGNTNDNNVASLDVMNTEQSIDIDQILASPQKNEVMVPNISNEKAYLQTAQDILNIPSIDLKIVVNKCLHLNAPMENHDRTVIAKAVMHHLLVNDFNREITTPEFVRLSHVIVDAFPMEENSTYYIPAHKNDQAQGKLHAQYNNYKALLRSAGLCKKRKYVPKRNAEGICNPETVEEPNQGDESSLKNTFEISDDLELIRKFWENSYFDPKKMLLELTTDEYIRKFPAFNLYNGYELFILDSEKILGQRPSNLLETAEKILIYSNRQKRPSPELKAFLLEYDKFSPHLQGKDLTSFRQLTALKLLPFVMPNPSRKLSKPEASSYFLPHCKTALEADTFRTNHFKPVETFPRLMFIGDTVKPTANIYVSDKHYIIEDPIKGFEVLFRAFLSLNCNFPHQSLHVWEFVQKIIYNFSSGTGKRIASAETFMQDIRNIKLN